MRTPRASLIPCLVVCLAALARAETAEERALRLNDRGVALAGAGRHPEAVEAFEGALDAAPESATIRTNLGRALGNWGVRLLDQGDALAAERATRRAVEILPDDAVLRLNLAACLDDRGFPARAGAEVRRAAELAPDLALARERLGSVHFREGRLAAAVESWEAAVRLGSRDRDVAVRLAQARAELAVEANLHRQTSAHFEILFDLERHGVLASKVLQAMEEAHLVVAAELQHFGQERLQVVLLPTETFQAVTGAHAWVAGLYDGRIRMPVKDAEQREDEVLARARHEYVHSVLAPLGRRAPPWLHEGLAQVFEGRSAAQALRRVAAAGPLGFDALTRNFADTRDSARASRQYDTALAFVAWLRTGERASGFRAAMAALFDDHDLDAAFRDGLRAGPAEMYGRFEATLPR